MSIGCVELHQFLIGLVPLVFMADQTNEVEKNQNLDLSGCQTRVPTFVFLYSCLQVFGRLRPLDFSASISICCNVAEIHKRPALKLSTFALPKRAIAFIWCVMSSMANGKKNNLAIWNALSIAVFVVGLLVLVGNASTLVVS